MAIRNYEGCWPGSERANKGDVANANVVLGFMAREEGDLDQAEWYNREVIRLVPKGQRSSPYSELGKILLSRGETRRAVRILSAAISSESRHGAAKGDIDGLKECRAQAYVMLGEGDRRD
jgi:hypothetical protein